MAPALSTALPVLDGTALRLQELHAAEDAVDAHLIAEAISDDPLMTLKLLAHVAHVVQVAGQHGARRANEPETVTAALLLLGIGPFFRAFGRQTTVSTHLAGRPDARSGFDAALRRAQRAAALAQGLAAQRADPDAPLLYTAALLHDIDELLGWLQLPAPEGWGLPQRLLRLQDEAQAAAPQGRCLLLALRLARHSASGWDDPALDDDVRDVAALLNLGETPARMLLREIDA